MDHQFTKSANISLNFQQLTNATLQQYCNYLKEYRLKVQPPFRDQPLKKQFCKQFDQTFLKRCLKEISEYTEAKRIQTKQRERSKNNQRKQSNEDICPPIQNSENKSAQVHYAPKTLMDKLMLYTWQLANFRTIYRSQKINEGQTGINSDSFIISNQVTNDLHHFCVSTCRLFLRAWGVKVKTMQAMMIAYFNLLKNGVMESDLTRNMSLGCLIQAVLGDVTRSIQHQACQPQKQPIRKRSHSQQKPQPHHPHTSAQLQLQFFCYILQLCSKKTSKFIQQVYLQLSNNSISKPTLISNSFLHFISLLINKMINDRITTEIVEGYQSQVEDVRKMYDSRESKCGRFYLQWGDYQWIVGCLFGVVMEGYKEELRNMWGENSEVSGEINKETNQTNQKKQLKESSKQIYDIHETNKNENSTHSPKKIRPYNRMYAEAVLNIIGIINCCTFLGGYSRQLQKKTTDLVMSNALEFLEISYIIYELCHAKQRNISVGSSASLQQAYKQNLYSLLHSSSSSITIKKEEGQLNSTQISQNSENLSKPILPPLPALPLQQCQLVSVLRLLSNLVHINPEAQKYFQDNLKYFRIVMSLTHECETEITMKNWAIVFLRNVAERSQIMRQELEKLKIDVKVDNGFEMKYM